jgi:hypothetical protein
MCEHLIYQMESTPCLQVFAFPNPYSSIESPSRYELIGLTPYLLKGGVI